MSATTGMSATPKTPPTQSNAPHNTVQTWSKRLCITIVVLLIFISFLYYITPVIGQYAAVYLLEKQGMSQVEIKKSTWKPWIPSITLNAIRWQTPSQEQVALKSANITLDWKKLLKKHIDVTHLSIEALELPIQMVPSLVIAGIQIEQPDPNTTAKQPPAEDSTPWQMSLSKLEVTNTVLSLKGLPLPKEYIQDQAHQFEINTLVISDFSTLSPQDKSNFKFKGKFDDLAFEIGANAAVLSETLATDANLTLLSIDPFASAKNWLQPVMLEGIKGNAALTFKLGIDHQNTKTGRQLDITLQLNIPSVATTLTKGMQKPVKLELDSFQLNSSTILNLAIPDFNIQTNSELQLQELQLSSHGIKANINQLKANLKLLNTQGQITTLEQTNAHLEGSITLQSLQIEGPEMQPALALTHLQTNGILKDRVIDIPHLSLKNIQILGEQKPLASQIKIQNIQVGQNELGEKSLRVEDVTVQDFNTRLELTPQGNLAIQEAINTFHNQISAILPLKKEALKNEESQNEPQPKKSNRPQKAKTQLNWEIGHVELVGDSTVDFLDNRKGFGIAHAFKIDIFDLKKVGFNQPTAIDFKSTLKNSGTITSKGQITLADIQANTILETVITNITLPSLSPYVIPIIGYSIDTGQLDSTISMKAKAGEGTSLIKIQAHTLNLKPADERIIASLSKELTMPLDLSLSLLKNKHDSIELEIPLSLNKKGINANIAPIIRQSLTRATKNASMTYLKYALQPYGSLLLLAEQSQKLMNEMQLVNISFAKMSATLDTDQLDPAQKIAKLLTNKPRMKIRLCPTASKEEAKEWPNEKEIDIAEALKTLALQRAQSMKLFFKEMNISEKRLFICAPKVVQSGTGEVKISL